MNSKWIFIFLLLSFYTSYSQSDYSLGCWEANTNYKNVNFVEKKYNLKIKKKSIEILINNVYKYEYKFHKIKGVRYFIMNEEKMILDEKSIKTYNYIKIRYFYKKNRVAVDEIITLEFKKC